MRKIAILALILSAAPARADVSFFETTSGSNPGLGGMFHRERLVRISGEKIKVMGRQTSEGSAEMKFLADKVTGALGGAAVSDEKKAQHAQKMEESKAQAGDEFQSDTERAVITRFDKGLIWEVDPNQKSYKEKKVADVSKAVNDPRNDMQGMKTIIELKATGKKDKAAGQACAVYQGTVNIDAGGQKMPFLSGEFCVAGDLKEPAAEVEAALQRYSRELGPFVESVDAAYILYNGPAMKEFREKVDALPGLTLRMKLTQMGSPSAFTWELTKLKAGPVDAAEFDVPKGYAKRK